MTVVRYSIYGAIIGLILGNIEYLISTLTETPESYWPLQTRAVSIGIIVGAISMTVEHKLRQYFKKRQFIFLVLTRAVIYTLIISLGLLTVNIVWFNINNDGNTPSEQMHKYLVEGMYFINVSSVFSAMILVGSFFQINSLHRRDELLNLILGKYHTPRKVNRIFCFIDLKGSTTITESLGDVKYAEFLRDYYSDLSDAIRATKAEIYQYVGDEIVLSWTTQNGLENDNCILCLSLMHEIIVSRTNYYLETYNSVPAFRAGVHSGTCIVTWVGEMKREIVYIGDVLNTTARIQEACKAYTRDILISETLLHQLDQQSPDTWEFIAEVVPRGKEGSVRLWGRNVASA